MPRTDLVLHQDEPYVPFLTAPKHPGLIYGKATLAQILDSFEEELPMLGIAGPYLLHTQFRLEEDGRACSIRFANDEHVEERLAVVELFLESDPEGLDHPDLMPDATGEYTIVACRREDLLEDLALQCGPTDILTFAAPDEDHGLLMRQLFGDDTEGPVMSAEVSGLTLGELLDGSPTRSARGEYLSMPKNALMFERIVGQSTSAYALVSS